MKFNPFRPNNMVGPGMFVGRVDEIDTIEQCLFQAIHENPQHFFIEGERGIGKSSLLFITEGIASGEILGDADKMSFLTVSVDMGGVETQLDIVRAIARQLRSSTADRQALIEKAKKVWDFLSKWEILVGDFRNQISRGRGFCSGRCTRRTCQPSGTAFGEFETRNLRHIHHHR